MKGERREREVSELRVVKMKVKLTWSAGHGLLLCLSLAPLNPLVKSTK